MNEEVKRSIMAIGAHADDIEVHVGGTLAKYHALGYEVVYVMSTNNMSGITSTLREDGSVHRIRETPVPMMKRRKSECDDAARALGTVALHLDHPQRHFNSGVDSETVTLHYGSEAPEGVPSDIPSILTACENAQSIDRLCDMILERDPECILTHGVAQRNIEHFATCLLVTNAFWQAVERGYQGGLLHWREEHTLHGDFNCRWETYVDCNNYLDRKMELIGLHRCQMPKAHLPDFGHRLLNEWRGKTCGCESAELFTWVRRPARTSPKISMRSYPIMGEITLELIQNSK